MNDELYTVILEFRGGTYIGQASKPSPGEAVAAWIESIPPPNAKSWELDKIGLLGAVLADDPTPLSGCTSVWCMSADVDGHMALINVVRTCSN